MSSVGSIVSSRSSVISRTNDPETQLLKYRHVRDYLGLGRFITKRNDKLCYDRYVQISSKTLGENYVVPDDDEDEDGNAVEDIFTKLSDLIRECKVQRKNLPKTDFTCLSRAARRKVWIDVDCMSCKSGDRPEDKRHIKTTKLVGLIVATIENVFDVTVEDGVYLTNGGNTCGFHVFFNTLAYDSATASAAESALMDALVNAFRRTNTKNASVDRGCTQMPLPTATHSNSTGRTRPFRMVKESESEWNKTRLNWDDMDVETLKCFSSIAFSKRYDVKVVEPPHFRSPDSFAPVTLKRKCDTDIADDSAAGKRTRLVSGGEEEEVDGKDSLRDESHDATPPPPEDEDFSHNDSLPATPSPPPPDGHKTLYNQISDEADCEMLDDSHKSSSGEKEDDDDDDEDDDTFHVDSTDGGAVARGGDVMPPPSAPTDRRTAETLPPPPRVDSREFIEDDEVSLVSKYTESSLVSSFRCPSIKNQRMANADSQKGTENRAFIEEDEVSLVSKYTESSLVSSFRCPSIKNQRMPKADGQKGTVKRGRNETSTMSTLEVIERLPYGCEDDKTSAFPDKQYKASLLCAEEEEAAVSKARLASSDNRTFRGEERRVYVIEGSSSNVPREYKLLVQLANVNRAVYQGDIWSVREWTDMLVSYYDQHLQNPVLLAMLQFVFRDRDVGTYLESLEIEAIVRSVVHLMTPFKSKAETNQALDADRSFSEEEFERGARPHKARVVGALIRVCTSMFNMTTAVLSDFWKVQKANESRDMSSLNRTVVNNRAVRTAVERSGRFRPAPDDDDDLDCSASMFDGSGGGVGGDVDMSCSLVANNYTLLASLIVHEQKNMADMSLFALLYYYHSFPHSAIDRIMDEVHHNALMVTAVIRYFITYNNIGKSVTLQEIFEGFNDCSVFLQGPEAFIKMRRKKQKRADGKKAAAPKKTSVKPPKNKDPDWKRRHRKNDTFDEEGGVEEDENGGGGGGENTIGGEGGVTPEEVQKVIGENMRRKEMCKGHKAGSRAVIMYDIQDKHMWEAVINYYLRPVSIHDDRMVFANDNYDTLEDDAVESSVAHLATTSKNTKGDVQTAFKDARTAWRMPHGSQLIYESDLKSPWLGCCFHINTALKMYEMFCGGCVTRMKRVHKDYLIDRTRFNMTIYDVVAECRTATVNLTAAIDRSYVNLLLRQPIVPPFLEQKEEIRRLHMSGDEIKNGSFCCLSVMDYIRALNLFDKSRYKCKSELDTCEYVEKFLNDLYTNEIAAEHPPNPAANARMRLLYAFYTLYLFEVVFNMRHVYAKRENLFVAIERLCNELDVRELIVLFFGESSMKRAEGLDDDMEHRIRRIADDWSGVKRMSKDESDAAASTAGGRFDVRPVLAAEIPDKMLRMKTLFGQFGFDVMQDRSAAVATQEEDSVGSAEAGMDCDPTDSTSRASFTSDESLSGGNNRVWDDDTKFEQDFYAADDWLDTVNERMLDRKIVKKTNNTVLFARSGESMFARETLRTIMRLEVKRHIDNDRLGKLADAARTSGDGSSAFDGVMAAARNLPMRLKLLAFILTTHTVKSKTKTLCPEVVESLYREADGRFADERRTYEGEINSACTGGGGAGGAASSNAHDPPEKVWCRRTADILSDDRLSLLLHARWLSEQRFKSNFFVGLNPAQVYNVLYEYMEDNVDRYPSFKEFYQTKQDEAKHLCTAMMFILVMSAYDQENVDLYLKMFLSVEWPGQWAKTIFVWKSNSNAGKSYLFDAIVKRACANSTCINDPKGGKENAPEKAEYVRNFVLFANEFSQANSNELKKIVSESTFKFRMNYGNVMNEAYATGKIMFNCNTLPPTSDEAAINRLTLFDIPFWFCRRQKISDAMLNWIRGPSPSASRWEIAYRHELPALLRDEEQAILKKDIDTKDEVDLFEKDKAVRQNILPLEYNKATSSLFLVQNKTSRLYVASSPPTDSIVRGVVNITTHFSWLRFFKRLDMPVDFTTLPASSEAVRSEWLSLTLPYQEWKQITGARTDTNRVPADSVYRSLQAFATKKNINYFGLKQFFETDFAPSREAIKDEYYMWFDSKAFRD